MMKLFVSGTNTNVGKTYITTKIAKKLIEKNITTTIIKPIETGVNKIPLDANLHVKNQSIKYNIDDICFYKFELPASPFVADTKNIINLDSMKDKIHNLEKKCNILIIEGAGGLFVPIKQNYFMIDLIKDLNAFCLLVGDSKLGCINNILSAREILKQRKIDFISIVNIFDESDFLKISYSFIKTLDKNFVYQLEEINLINYIINYNNK